MSSSVCLVQDKLFGFSVSSIGIGLEWFWIIHWTAQLFIYHNIHMSFRPWFMTWPLAVWHTQHLQCTLCTWINMVFVHMFAIEPLKTIMQIAFWHQQYSHKGLDKSIEESSKYWICLKCMSHKARYVLWIPILTVTWINIDYDMTASYITLRFYQKYLAFAPIWDLGLSLSFIFTVYEKHNTTIIHMKIPIIKLSSTIIRQRWSPTIV